MSGILEIKLVISTAGKWEIEVTKEGDIILVNLTDNAIKAELVLEELRLWTEDKIQR